MAKRKGKSAGNPKFKTAVRVLVSGINYGLREHEGEALVDHLEGLASDFAKLVSEQKKALAGGDVIERYAERARLPSR